MPKTIYTIGYATHTLEHFISLLKKQEITALCDVRSTPYSRLHSDFNRENLKKSLQKHEILYIFLGKELGARSDDPSCYNQGIVEYDRLAQTKLFHAGLERVQEGVKNYKISLMCAEKDPLDCHRTILISKHLISLNFNISHIHADGSIEDHESAMTRLLHRLHLPENDMFSSRCDIV